MGVEKDSKTERKRKTRENIVKWLPLAAVGLIVLVVFVVPAFVSSGIGRPKDVSSVAPSITNKEKLSWHCDFAGHTWVDIKAYLSPASPSLEQAFKEQQALRDQCLARARRMAELAPTKELQKTYKEEMQLYEKEFFRFAGSFDNWPIVMVVPVLLECAAPTKVIVICRYELKPVDLIFTMYCPHQITHRDFLRIAKELTLKFEVLNENQWTELPTERGPIFNDEGDIISEEIVKFAEDSVFIIQR